MTSPQAHGRPDERGADTGVDAATLAARLLRAHPERRWSVADLASQVHLSTSQLRRLFVRRHGMPPMHYLARVRAHRLAHLLQETNLPIGEAMAHVGWRSRGHASRQFLTIMGMTPTAFRRQVRGP